MPTTAGPRSITWSSVAPLDLAVADEPGDEHDGHDRDDRRDVHLVERVDPVDLRDPLAAPGAAKLGEDGGAVRRSWGRTSTLTDRHCRPWAAAGPGRPALWLVAASGAGSASVEAAAASASTSARASGTRPSTSGGGTVRRVAPRPAAAAPAGHHRGAPGSPGCAGSRPRSRAGCARGRSRCRSPGGPDAGGRRHGRARDPVVSAEQQRGPVAGSTESVDRDHDVDMVEEARPAPVTPSGR